MVKLDSEPSAFGVVVYGIRINQYKQKEIAQLLREKQLLLLGQFIGIQCPEKTVYPNPGTIPLEQLSSFSSEQIEKADEKIHAVITDKDFPEEFREWCWNQKRQAYLVW